MSLLLLGKILPRAYKKIKNCVIDWHEWEVKWEKIWDHWLEKWWVKIKECFFIYFFLVSSDVKYFWQFNCFLKFFVGQCIIYEYKSLSFYGNVDKIWFFFSSKRVQYFGFICDTGLGIFLGQTQVSLFWEKKNI